MGQYDTAFYLINKKDLCDLNRIPLKPALGGGGGGGVGGGGGGRRCSLAYYNIAYETQSNRFRVFFASKGNPF